MRKLRLISKINRSLFLIFVAVTVILGISFKFYSDKKGKTESTAPEYIQAQAKLCSQKGEGNKCYEKMAINILARYPMAKVLEVLSQNEKMSELSDCHKLTHFLGQTEYRKTGDIQAVFATPNWQICLMGVYHGALEEYFTEKGITDPESSLTKKELAEVCGEQNDFTQKQLIECTHGLGHATMLLTNNDLPRALELCDVLSTELKKESCYNGAMMENGNDFGNPEHPTKYVKANDPLYPCPILKEPYQMMCYTNGIINRFQYDLKKSVLICSEVPVKFQSGCFEQIGSNGTQNGNIQGRNHIMSLCSQISSPELEKKCVKSISGNLIIDAKK